MCTAVPGYTETQLRRHMYTHAGWMVIEKNIVIVLVMLSITGTVDTRYKNTCCYSLVILSLVILNLVRSSAYTHREYGCVPLYT